MNATRYTGGPTGSVHRPAGQTALPSDHYRHHPNHPSKKWGDTTSSSGEVSRVFVGSIDKASNCADIGRCAPMHVTHVTHEVLVHTINEVLKYQLIENIFSKYGKINGVDINSNGFAFVQFNEVDEAKNACEHENGQMFRGRKIEVRMFDKSNHPVKGRPFTRDRSRSPVARRAGPTGTRRGAGLPPGSHFDDDYDFMPAPPMNAPPPPNAPGNEAEIIVINKEQWGYAEMLERRIRQESGVEFIDMLFLHTPSSLNMTLNDLYERRTLYAIVVSPTNEQNQSLTLHVLYNQTEHRNMPLEDAIQLIKSDYHLFMGRSGPPPPPPPRLTGPPLSGIGDRNGSANIDLGVGNGKLPDDIGYLLKTVLQEEGPQFLSLPQIDSIIDYFNRERNRLTSRAQSFQGGGDTSRLSQASGSAQPSHQSELNKQRETLLDNPHVQAALSSLIQIGALNNMTVKQDSYDSSGVGSLGGHNLNAAPYGVPPPSMPPHQMMTNENMAALGALQAPRRHPLLGTEVGLKPSILPSIPGAPGGLVRYPPPQSYAHYNIKPDY